MLIVTYDISDDTLRTRFSTFLRKFGHRLQYSTYEIRNSPRMLNIISSEIRTNYEKKFSQKDSVIIFQMSKQCRITRYGYAQNDEQDLIII